MSIVLLPETVKNHTLIIGGLKPRSTWLEKNVEPWGIILPYIHGNEPQVGSYCRCQFIIHFPSPFILPLS